MGKRRGLSPDAYRVMDGEKYQPYVPPEQETAEFTRRAGILGVVLGIIFGAANAYLGLKVGMTVTASIPVAVISMGILRSGRRGTTVLENNIVQTIGSAGESIAAGVIFTIPALLLMGLSPSVVSIFTVAALGGLLGVFLMIPLRHLLMVKEHGALPYPEGTGCAEVLVAGEEGGSKIKTVFAGLGIGALYKVLMDPHLVGLWRESPSLRLPFLRKGLLSFDAYPALLGVGFIIGPRIASLMMAGGALAWLGLIPLIATVGDQLPTPLFPSSTPISEMGPSEIWSRYVRYIGAGAVAFGGIISLIKAIPMVSRSFARSLAGFRLSLNSYLPRTARDLPGSVVLLGALGISLLLWWAPFIQVNLLGALLMVIFTFFFGSVASRLVGLVGGSSLPVSGMTIAALLGTALLFNALGWSGMEGKVAALLVGAVVCVGISAAGDMSQDLKTGFLVGATPWKQQVGEFLGVLTAAPIIGLVVLLLHRAFLIGSESLPAPQATLMRLVVEGVMDRNLPWDFVLAGMVIAGVIELLRLPSLPFAVGLYLPFSLSLPIMAGGLLRGWVERRYQNKGLKEGRENGVLFGSGLVAGEATVGVLIALLVYAQDTLPALQSLKTPFIGELPMPGLAAMIAFAFVGYALLHFVQLGVKEGQN